MSATWPNEPSGAVTLLDHGFANYSPFYYGGAELATDATAPVSPPNVMKSTIYPGQVEGGSQMNWSAGRTYNDMFVALSWRTNADFFGRTTANKMFFVRGPQVNGFFGLGGSGTGPFEILFGHNTASLDNSHIWLQDLGLVSYANAARVYVSRNTWTKIEVYIHKSTTSTSRDGIVRLWVNGIKTMDFNTVNYAPNGLDEYVWSETWDGTVTNPVPSTEWSHYVDHLYISTGGTPSSGGTNPPPPIPDPPPPPPPPTDPPPPPPAPVVLQSMTPANLSTTVGTAKQFTITMSGAMQTATSLFTTSSDPTVATVPASVTITAGASTALVTASPIKVGSTTISTNYNGVTKGATLQVGTAGSTSGSTVYDYSLQFSGTQGSDGWYYLEDNGTQMTYSGGSSTWTGSDTYGGNLQTIWGSGFHPGGTRATILRFVVPASGSADIDGSFYDLDTAGGTGAVARVMHNGVTLFTRTIANGDTTGGVYDLTQTVRAGDHIDFVVANQTADYQNNSTSLNPVITLAAVSTEPTPPPPPSPPASVVDFFTTVASVTAGTAFSMTVRLSEPVSVDTAVEIRVGSTSILSAPTSVTVASGTSEKSFNVTPLVASTVAIEAVLNGIKRVTLTVQPTSTDPTPDPEPGPSTDPSVETKVLTITPSADGARITLNQSALALAFRYDASPDWTVIPEYALRQTDMTHEFTWPSGTTTICYRAQAVDDTWGPALCVAYEPPKPPLPLPAVNKSLVDKFGVRWQLTGKKAPFILKRNGSAMDNTYGLLIRKSGDGYMEILQTNNTWLRRVSDAWELVE